MIAQALSAMLPIRASSEDRDPLSNFWYAPVGRATASGIRVTQDRAMKVSAVSGCERVIRESFASLPWKVFEETGENSKEPAKGYYLWSVLQKRPNPWQTPIQFKEMGAMHVLRRGNFYCHIVGTGSGMMLIPLDPDRMVPEQRDDLTIDFAYTEKSGKVTHFDQDDIFHVPGPSLDGITGVSVLTYASETIGSAIAQETHGASLFRNGGLPAFWIGRPAGKAWTDTARSNFRKDWKGIHGGAENAGNPAILGDGMELHEVSLSNRDSQWLESRSFTAEELCRFYGVFPYMIGLKSGSPKGTAEQQGTEFVNYTLGPFANRFEQAANRDLVADDDHFTTFIFDALLRGDTTSRYAAHNIAVQGGWKTKNEVRAVEDLNPKEGGDELQQALNMQPAGGGPDQNEQGGQPGKGLPKGEDRGQRTEDREEEKEDEPTPREKKKQKKKAATVGAVFQGIILDAASRIASAELRMIESRIEKADEDKGRWNMWLMSAYEKNRQYATGVLDPVCSGIRGYAGIHPLSGPQSETVANAIVNPPGPILDAITDTQGAFATVKENLAGDRYMQLCQTLLVESGADDEEEESEPQISTDEDTDL